MSTTRLPEFEYHRPRTIREVARCLNEWGPEARILAGGTDLLVNMKHRLETPEHLVDVTGVAEMKRIVVEPDGTVRIGAAVTVDGMAAHPEIRQRFPGLATAAWLVAGPSLKRMGTVGGNVMLDTRCYYFNQSSLWRAAKGDCMKITGDVCFVAAKSARCFADFSADTPPVFQVLDAQFRFVSLFEERLIDARDFYVEEGIERFVRRPDEVLTEVIVPPTWTRSERCTSTYEKFRPRNSIDFPIAGVALAVHLDETGSVEKVQCVLNAVASSPLWLDDTKRLVGVRLTEKTIEEFAEVAQKRARAFDNTAGTPLLRRKVIRALTRDAFTRVVTALQIL